MDAEEPTHGEPVVLALEGAFDVSAARQLVTALQRLPPGAPVRLDFSQVRAFDDFGVGVLAQALDGAGARVRLCGLRRHQARLLRYLGVELGGDPDVAHG